MGWECRAWDGDSWRSAPCAPVGKYSTPGIGIPGEARPCAPVGWVPAGAPQARPTNASAWVRTKRDQTLRPSRPMKGAINSNHRTGAQRPEGSAPATERCPAGEGLNTPTAGPDRGRRTCTLQPSAHAACGELRQIRSGSAPSRATERPARVEGGTPRFLWRETLEKPDNAVIINRAQRQRKGFGRPSAQSVQ